MTKKTLKEEDWDKIKNSFSIMGEFFTLPTRVRVFRFTCIEGILEQIEQSSVGQSVFFLDYAYETPQICKCEVIEELE